MMPSSKIRRTGFDVPGDRKERMEAREKKVRKKQVGVVDFLSSLFCFPLFPLLTVVVSTS